MSKSKVTAHVGSIEGGASASVQVVPEKLDQKLLNRAVEQVQTTGADLKKLGVPDVVADAHLKPLFVRLLQDIIDRSLPRKK